MKRLWPNGVIGAHLTAPPRSTDEEAKKRGDEKGEIPSSSRREITALGALKRFIDAPERRAEGERATATGSEEDAFPLTAGDPASDPRFPLFKREDVRSLLGRPLTDEGSKATPFMYGR